MEKEKITKLEQRANELFGKKSLVSIAEIKFADIGYMVRIKMQGLPFEISAIKDTLEDAEELAIAEFENMTNYALKNDLFPTQPIEKYESLKLTDEQFNRLFRFEELLDDEYICELKKETIAKVCQLPDGRYECVLESPYMCLHARGRSGTIPLAILSATMRAYEVFRASLISVGNKPWKK